LPGDRAFRRVHGDPQAEFAEQRYFQHADQNAQEGLAQFMLVRRQRLQRLPILVETLEALDWSGQQRERVQLVNEIAPQRRLLDVAVLDVDDIVDLPEEDEAEAHEIDGVGEQRVGGDQLQKRIAFEDHECRGQRDQIGRQQPLAGPADQDFAGCIAAEHERDQRQQIDGVRRLQPKENDAAKRDEAPPHP
jgi:hypothetical protein